MVYNQSAGVSYHTKFVRTRNMFAMQFSNKPITLEGVNAFNANLPLGESYLTYQGFYTAGKLQIPMIFYEYDDPLTGNHFEFENTQYCNCIDGACDALVWQ